jgi:VanZ family protein
LIIKSLYYVPALLWAIIIYFLSTTSAENLPKFNLLSADKIGHLCFYAGLTFWLLWAGRKADVSTNISTAVALILAASYGTALEYRQAYLPDRAFDYADMLANFAGCALGYFSFSIAWKVSEYFFSFFFKKNVKKI